MTSRSPQLNIPKDIQNVLTFLNDQIPANHAGTKTKAASGRARWSNGLMWAGGISFILLALLALAQKLFGLPHILLYAAVGCGIAAQVLPVLALSLEVLPGLVMLFRYQKWAGDMRLVEFKHDMDAACQLAHRPPAVLKAADFWLGQYMDRAERRLKLFFSGSDKLAALSVIAGAWSILKAFPEAPSIMSRLAPAFGGTSLDTSANFVLIAVCAFVFGLTFGGMLMRQVIQRISYQRDLIALALAVEPGEGWREPVRP